MDLSKLLHRETQILDEEMYTKFAVFLPLIKINNQEYILLQIRSENLKRQPGEICFPGGHIEKSDNSPKEAAIRETCEELGIKENNLEVIAQLDTLITPFNTMIYSFVGTIENTDIIKPNPLEVAEVFWVPLDYFLENDPLDHHIKMIAEPSKEFPLHLIPGGYKYNWRVGRFPEYFYLYEDKVIWGLTARIIKHFIDLLKKDRYQNK